MAITDRQNTIQEDVDWGVHVVRFVRPSLTRPLGYPVSVWEGSSPNSRR